MNKADKEQMVFERLRALSPEFGDGPYRRPDPPDYVITRPDGLRIGVELTQLFRESSGPPLQEHESNSSRVLAEAKRIWGLAGLPNVIVHVDFAGHLTRKALVSLPPRLAEFVQEMLRRDVKRWPRDEDFDEGPAHVSGIRIHKVECLAATHFLQTPTGWMQPLPENLIRNALRVKHARMRLYRKECDRVWLVLWTDSGSISSGALDENPGLASLKFETQFDRLFLLQGGRLSELSVLMLR